MVADLKIIYNAIKTPDGTVLESRHRHDYKTYIDPTDGKKYMVDGGLDYLRHSMVGDNISLYSDEPHEVQRRVITWGTNGIGGTGAMKYIKIKDLSTNHLSNILGDLTDGRLNIYEQLRDCLILELRQRVDKQIEEDTNQEEQDLITQQLFLF